MHLGKAHSISEFHLCLGRMRLYMGSHRYIRLRFGIDQWLADSLSGEIARQPRDGPAGAALRRQIIPFRVMSPT